MRKGQALLEVIIATAIISIGLLVPLSLVVQSMSVGQQSKERTQATFLAQETIERIYSIRDANFNNSRVWTDYFYTVDGYYDWDSCCAPSDKYIFLSEVKQSDGQVVPSTIPILDNVRFYRYIHIKKINDSKIEINVEVTWPREYNNNPVGRVNLSSIITKWL